MDILKIWNTNQSCISAGAPDCHDDPWASFQHRGHGTMLAQCNVYDAGPALKSNVTNRYGNVTNGGLIFDQHPKPFPNL